MASTPEGRTKKLVKDLLSKYTPRYEYWPVPAGFGPSSLDCIVCYRGLFLAVETKAPGKKPTPRQELCIRDMQAAQGATFVVDGPESLAELEKYLDRCKQHRPL